MNKEDINYNSFTKSNNDIRNDIIKNKECGCIAYAMYMTLLSHRNSQNGKCFPSISSLSNEMDCSISKVKRLITSLHDNGYILINSGKIGINNDYYFPYEDFYSKDECYGQMAKRRKNVLSDDIDKELKKKSKSKNKKESK